LGRLDEALATAERGLSIMRELGHEHEVAADLTQIAAILKAQQRYGEADEQYEDALNAARAADDLGLQGAILQHQGDLQHDLGNVDRAVELYQQAITLFQSVGDAEGEMQTCDLLATAEMERGQLPAAASWYGRGRELALQLNDRAQLAANAQNVGILYQTRAGQAADPAERAALLRQAVESVQESLAIKLEMQDPVGAASSHFQLGILYRMVGDLEQAEGQAGRALQIYESLGLPDVYKVYGNLAEIARARGDEAAAATWQAKHDAKLAELQQLRVGATVPGRPSLVALVLALAQAAYQARVTGSPLAPDAAEALAQLAAQPPPLGGLGAFLQAAAAGGAIRDGRPDGLPPALAEVVEEMVRAVARAA
jgi:tetratricopeptide (TPR) repeat protein